MYAAACGGSQTSRSQSSVLQGVPETELVVRLGSKSLTGLSFLVSFPFFFFSSFQ